MSLTLGDTISYSSYSIDLSITMCLLARWYKPCGCSHPAHNDTYTRTYCGDATCNRYWSWQQWFPRNADRIVDLTCDTPDCPTNLELLKMLAENTDNLIEDLTQDDGEEQEGCSINVAISAISIARDKLAAAGYIEPEAGMSKGSDKEKNKGPAGVHNPLQGHPSRVWQQHDFMLAPPTGYNGLPGAHGFQNTNTSGLAQSLLQPKNSLGRPRKTLQPASAPPAAASGVPDPATPGLRRPPQGRMSRHSKQQLWDLYTNQNLSWEEIRERLPV